jgi:hypothetical protein
MTEGWRDTEHNDTPLSRTSFAIRRAGLDVRGRVVLRIRQGRMVWFVRYLFEGSARRYRIGEHPAVGLSAVRKIASVVRG